MAAVDICRKSTRCAPVQVGTFFASLQGMQQLLAESRFVLY
jgi:hypothetical protein